MTAANFPAELADELVFEGGFSDNPEDPGGATEAGITLATYSAFEGQQMTIAQLQAMDDATKAAIYRAQFWRVINGDNLPSGLDLEVFDMAVNGGPGRAARILQGLVGVAQDGDIGPATLAAITASGPLPGLISAYADARRAYYQKLPTFVTFGADWLSRIGKCEAEALALAA